MNIQDIIFIKELKLAISNFISIKYSTLVELAAQETSIAVRITGGQYQVDATGTSAIKIARVGDINIINYTNDTDLSALQKLSDEGYTLSLNQKKAFNFTVDDVDQAQSAGDFSPAAMTQAAMGLALEADKYALGLFGDAAIPSGNKLGTLAVPISITAANVDEYIYNAKEILDGQNAGPNRWLVVPSWFMTKLALSGLGVQLGESVKDDLWREGEVVRYAGFNIVQSNSLTVDDTADGYQIMAYSSRAIPMVAQVQKVENLRNPNRFGEIVRGLYVFGAKIVFPKEVVVLSAVKGA